MACAVPVTSGGAVVPDPRARQRAPRGHRPDPDRGARQGALRRDGRGGARPRGGRARVRDPDPAQGRLLGAGLDGRRRLLDPPAARRGRRHHAVQLPGDGADVDVGAGARLRQLLRAEAVGEGSERVPLRGRAARTRRASRPACSASSTATGRGRAAARAPGRRGGLVRRLDADRPLDLRDGHQERQARAGARRREEPHGRSARRRHRHGRRRRRQRRLRLGRRALHGRLGRGRGRRRRRPARRRDPRPAAEREGRPGARAGARRWDR